MKKRLFPIIVILVGAVILAVIILIKQLSQPAVGKVRSKTAAASAPQAATWTKLEAKQYSVEFLNDYVFKQGSLQSESDSYFLIEDGLITKHLAIAVTNIGAHSLDEEPAFQMRSLAPQTYKLETRSITSRQVPVMVRLDNTEQVAFIVKGNKLGTIALTTGNPADPPVGELNHMIASWTWK